MDQGRTVLRHYEQMADLASAMVDASRQQDWDRLVQLEQEVAALRDQLIAHYLRPTLTADERRRKVAFIHRILDHDAEVRRHTEPWMEQVSRFLGSAARERKLQRTYGGAAGM